MASDIGVERGTKVPGFIPSLILVLTLLSILPIWTFKYFPSVDGPSHVENSYMLSHYGDESMPFRDYYDVNKKPVPNWLSHAILASLMKVLPPLVSEKILLTGYVVLFVLAMLYFVRSGSSPGGSSPGKRRDWLVVLTIPLIYNYLLHNGFYNFVISFPLVFVSVGYWWRRRDESLGWRQVVVLDALLTLLYFSNILSTIVAVACVMVLALFHHRARLMRALGAALAMAPAYALPLYYLSSSWPEGVTRAGEGSPLTHLGTVVSLVSFDSREGALGLALVFVLAALVVYTALSERLGRAGLGGRDPEGGAAGGTSGRARDLADRQAFLVLALVLTALCVLSPRRAFGGGVITERLSLFPVIAMLPWLSDRLPRGARSGIVAAAALIAVIHIGVTAHYYQIVNRGLEEYTSGAGLIERGSTVLPIGFDQKGEAGRVRIYRHAASYYAIVRDAVNLANYEGDKAYFPLVYKRTLNPFASMGQVESQRGNLRPERYPGRIDYVLLWSAPAEFPALAWIEANFDLVHSQGRLDLYRNRQPGAERRQKEACCLNRKSI